ncbi:MAG: GTP-binding protein gtr1 [Ramalina farinacea]|uniref:GTP-binding protein n=1 Tax=Ramalina farinacea TaxID=258253 RepID=A0AA43QFN4_9LECA|nr:GTP-binding protein gtr1 [Ramalina farinacea]
MDNLKTKPAKKKILLMGKSGSGKSSMRSIIFSNFVAKDVRRLGATIDVEHAQFKFLGNLILNLWDCGGQDAFTETYLTSQKSHVFSEVGVLIYVFDTESRQFHSPNSKIDLDTYAHIINALHQYSPHAHVFCLVHKMDLVPNDRRDEFLDNKSILINHYSGGFKNAVRTYGTSIWDQTLYLAWGDIVQCLTPNLDLMRNYLSKLGQATKAEEIVLFERATFLRVTDVTTPTGEENPYSDRFERLSNLIKTFKHSLQMYTGQGASHPFGEFTISCPRFNLVLSRLTPNTYVLVVLPPGGMDLVNTRLNIMGVRDGLAALDQPG